jgi:hypothetical protein
MERAALAFVRARFWPVVLAWPATPSFGLVCGKVSLVLRCVSRYPITDLQGNPF